jgi:hypothetical protein
MQMDFVHVIVKVPTWFDALLGFSGSGSTMVEKDFGKKVDR